MTNDQIVATLREKADRLDRFFGTMSDDGKAPRADRTLMLEAAATIRKMEGDIARIEGFARTMFTGFLVGIENNKSVTGWSRQASDDAEKLFVAAMHDYRLSLAEEEAHAAQVDRNPKGHDPAEGHGRNDESPVAATSGDAPEGS